MKKLSPKLRTAEVQLNFPKMGGDWVKEWATTGEEVTHQPINLALCEPFSGCAYAQALL
jgi:hypothetical protein